MSKKEQAGLAHIVQVYALLACISLGAFGLLHVLSATQHRLGYIEMGGSGLFLFNAGLAAVPRRLGLAKNYFLILVLAFLLVMLVSGGTQGTGVFWYFVFPVGAFFFSGKRQGLCWMVALLMASAVVWLLAERRFITIAYSSIVLRQLFVSVAVVGLGIYVYQETRERLSDQSRASSQKLHSEKALAAMVVHHIQEGIVATDADGRVTFMNPAAVLLLCWKPAELVGKRFVEAVPLLEDSGDVLTPQHRPLYMALREGTSHTVRAAYRRKDGASVAVVITGEPIKVDGEITGGLTTFRSIDEERSIAKAKSEFVTLASHQLRTPLSAVSWLSELLLHGDAGPLTTEQTEHVQAIYRSNQRMGDIVNEMLLVSSLELNTLPVMLQPLHVPEIASQIVREQVAAYGEAHRVIEQYEAETPPLKCDADVLKMLLRHLLSNALKYTPKTGTIDVGVSVDRTAKLHPGSHGSVVITVRDTGYGIPEAAKARIFTKFFRARNIIHRDTDGTGLGLYIVKGLLDYVGGRISFDSTEGRGSAFTVFLPLEGMKHHEPQGDSVGPIARRGILAAKTGGTHV